MMRPLVFRRFSFRQRYGRSLVTKRRRQRVGQRKRRSVEGDGPDGWAWRTQGKGAVCATRGTYHSRCLRSGPFVREGRARPSQANRNPTQTSREGGSRWSRSLHTSSHTLSSTLRRTTLSPVVSTMPNSPTEYTQDPGHKNWQPNCAPRPPRGKGEGIRAYTFGTRNAPLPLGRLTAPPASQGGARFVCQSTKKSADREPADRGFTFGALRAIFSP